MIVSNKFESVKFTEGNTKFWPSFKFAGKGRERKNIYKKKKRKERKNSLKKDPYLFFNDLDESSSCDRQWGGKILPELSNLFPLI